MEQMKKRDEMILTDYPDHNLYSEAGFPPCGSRILVDTGAHP